MNLSLSIKTRLLIFAIGISLIPIAIITTIYYLHARSTLKNHTTEELRAIAESKRLHIVTFMETLQVRALDFSTDEFIRNRLDTIVCRNTIEQDTVNKLNDYLSSINTTSLYHHLAASALVDKFGKVVASTNDKLIGKDMSDQDAFTQGISKNYGDTYVSKPRFFPYLDTQCILISAPIASKQNAEPIGVIINAYSLDVLDKFTTDRIGMGNTGETYLVNKDKIMFTKSRFLDNAPLNLVVDTEPVRKIIEGNKDMVGIYADYRGVPVVGAAFDIAEYGWILLAEIDKTEAFAPLRSLGSVALILGIIVSTATIGLGTTFAVSTSIPIKNITHATERIARGDLSYRVNISRTDEIGVLARSFNTMASELSREINEHNRAKKEQARLVAILDATSDFVAITDTSGHVLYMNNAGRKMIGIEEHEDISKTTILDYHPDCANRIIWNKGIPSAIRDGVWEGETMLLSRNGTHIPISQVIIAHKLPDGEEAFLSTIARDVTERKQMEEELRILNKSLEKRVAERAADIIKINEELQLEIAERKRMAEELKSLNEYLEERVADRAWAFVKANKELEMKIVEIKWAETALRSSEELFRQLTENIQQVFRMTSPDGYEMLYVSPAYEKIWGRTCKSLYENPADWINAIHHNDAERVRTAFLQKAAQGGFDEEYQIVQPDGSVRWIRDRAFPVKDESGEVCRIAGIAEDITERKLSEVKIRKLNSLLLSIRDINETLLTSKDETELFKKVCKHLSQVEFIRFAWIGLIENENHSMNPVAHAGSDDSFLLPLKGTSNNSDNNSVPADIPINTGAPVITKDINNVQSCELCTINSFQNSYPSNATIPLKHNGDAIGALHVYSDKKDDFGDEEIKYLIQVAGDIAIGVKSLRLEKELHKSIGDLQKSLNSSIEAIALMSEMRDPYTAGHEKRVAQLACSIARELGFSKDRIEGIRVSAFLHDVGKIVVPAEILSKPGLLNEYEFGIIKNHPSVGYDILKGLDFPWPVAMATYQHHECLDGSGYPNGLKGDEIILEARILAVADVVEAMASHRPYRPALGIDMALEEITRNLGILYDPDVANACVKLFTEKMFQFESADEDNKSPLFIGAPMSKFNNKIISRMG